MPEECAVRMFCVCVYYTAYTYIISMCLYVFKKPPPIQKHKQNNQNQSQSTSIPLAHSSFFAIGYFVMATNGKRTNCIELVHIFTPHKIRDNLFKMGLGGQKMKYHRIRKKRNPRDKKHITFLSPIPESI